MTPAAIPDETDRYVSTRDPVTGRVHGLWFCRCGWGGRSPMQLQTHILERHYGNEPRSRHSFSITVNDVVGLPDYKTYLQSPHWLATRSAYLALYGDRCRWLRRWNRQRCGAEPVEIHHLTYDRLGAEQLGDLIGLCGKHHEDAHAIAEAKRHAAMIDQVIADDEDRNVFHR